jgi:hypothetical protein
MLYSCGLKVVSEQGDNFRHGTSGTRAKGTLLQEDMKSFCHPTAIRGTSVCSQGCIDFSTAQWGQARRLSNIFSTRNLFGRGEHTSTERSQSCDAGATQNLLTLLKLTSLTPRGGRPKQLVPACCNTDVPITHQAARGSGQKGSRSLRSRWKASWQWATNLAAGVDLKYLRYLGPQLERVKRSGGPGCDGEDTT